MNLFILYKSLLLHVFPKSRFSHFIYFWMCWGFENFKILPTMSIEMEVCETSGFLKSFLLNKRKFFILNRTVKVIYCRKLVSRIFRMSLYNLGFDLLKLKNATLSPHQTRCLQLVLSLPFPLFYMRLKDSAFYSGKHYWIFSYLFIYF